MGAEGVRKLAGECLNLNDETGGKAGRTPPLGCARAKGIASE